MNNAPIGIFDSGFGGLSIYRSIARAAARITVYIGDHAYAPYGGKTKSEDTSPCKKIYPFFTIKKL